MGYYEFKKEDAYEFARASGIQTKQRGDELQFLYCPYCNGGKNRDKYRNGIRQGKKQRISTAKYEKPKK